MTYKNAIQLHTGDEVTVKKTHQVMTVVEIESVKAEDTTNHIPGVSVHLDDGNWYGYKEIS